MELKILFESRVDQPRYESLLAELAAVGSGEKPISVIHFAADGLAENHEYQEFRAAALMRGLVCVVEAEGDSVVVSVAKANELWRVPALRALRAAFGARWSDEAEVLTSSLLGYSADERAAWLEDRNRRHIGWGMRTVFALVNKDRLEGIRKLGMRAFPEGFPDLETPVFAHNSQCLRLEAADLIPPELTLVRFGGDHRFFIERARSPDGEMILFDIAASETRLLNFALRSTVQVLRNGTWRMESSPDQ